MIRGGVHKATRLKPLAEVPGSVVPTAGRWQRDEDPVYFLAGNTSRLHDAADVYDWLLIPVNDLESEGGERLLTDWLDRGKRVLLDSGIFWLSMSHARAHGIPMDQALALAPEKVDGFDKLFEQYVHLCQRFGDRLWGYIELDQGGRENKRRTRKRLHDLGLRPIPVYHPFNDGWEYFDELAETSDRLCLGNVVQANVQTRMRLMTTIYQRRQRYPYLWVHALGVTPNTFMTCVPPNSSDSSTWMWMIRWSSPVPVRAMGKRVGRLSIGYQYKLGEVDGERGSKKGCRLLALSAGSEGMNWHRAISDQRMRGFGTA